DLLGDVAVEVLGGDDADRLSRHLRQRRRCEQGCESRQGGELFHPDPPVRHGLEGACACSGSRPGSQSTRFGRGLTATGGPRGRKLRASAKPARMRCFVERTSKTRGKNTAIFIWFAACASIKIA